jgi:hypothetical protein
MRFAPRPLVVFAGVTLLLALHAPAQELPGTPSGELPPPLRSPYQDRGVVAPPETPKGVPPSRPLALFRLVPDLRIGVGYSDNLFITPDVFSFRTISDGLAFASPRLRALLRLSTSFGLLGDFTLDAQKFLHHGDSIRSANLLFLAYRPVENRHAEIGLRGGLARVSEFSPSDVNEGHVFVGGTYGIGDGASALGATASIGLREFPNRTQTESTQLAIGLGPLTLPLPLPPSTTTSRGQEDVVINVGGNFSQALTAHAGLQLGYDFTGNDSDVSAVDFQAHRVSLGAANAWTAWLSTQLVYSASFRRFGHPTGSPAVRREDTIHTLSLGAGLAPSFLSRIPLTRSALFRLGYDVLLDRSNIDTAEFDRNYVSLAIEVGFRPL